MVILMKPSATERDVEYVLQRADGLGLRTHVSEHDGRTVIGLLGDLHGISSSALLGLHGVERLAETSRPFRLASLDFRSEPTLVTVGDCEFGSREVLIIAGPCSVESSNQIVEIAGEVRQSGARLLRGGAFKPRSSPYSFRGHAEDGLEMLAAARAATGLPIVTEVMASEQVPLVSRYADVMQIGTRNMQNYSLLDAVGETQTPVLLKRGMMSTIKELLLSAEYILARGNPNVILCERGIRTFETATRNTLDINAVPVLKELTHLPVVVDPSHATGASKLVGPVSRAAVAAGADGLLVEVHPDPDSAWSDGMQTLDPTQFRRMMGEIRPIAAAIGRSIQEPPVER